MDYKNLIKKLEYQAKTIRNNNCTTMSAEESEAAANAIETLLAERDAAVEELRGLCWCCANGEKLKKAPMWSMATTCKYMRELGALARSGGKCKCQHWQWRGPQKHD